MNTQNDVIEILRRTLQLHSDWGEEGAGTRLLGELPEFDSMAVVTVLTALEERYGFVVDDDEIDAETFETVASLTRFVEQKLAEEA